MRAGRGRGVTGSGVIHPSGLRSVDGRSWVRSSDAADRRSHELRTNPSLPLFSAGDLAPGSRYRVKGGRQGPWIIAGTSPLAETRAHTTACSSGEMPRHGASLNQTSAPPMSPDLLRRPFHGGMGHQLQCRASKPTQIRRGMAGWPLRCSGVPQPGSSPSVTICQRRLL
jgi:hypothetical protein